MKSILNDIIYSRLVILQNTPLVLETLDEGFWFECMSSIILSCKLLCKSRCKRQLACKIKLTHSNIQIAVHYRWIVNEWYQY